jgi:hypothetical protein
MAVVLNTAGAVERPFIDLPRWRRMSPSAEWISIDLSRAPLRREREWIADTIDHILTARYLPISQLVLVGEYEAGRLVLELVLDGGLECSGLLALNVPGPAIAKVTPTVTAIRLVMQQRSFLVDRDDGLLAGLRQADLDERIMILHERVDDGTEAVARAAEIFLQELVANASRNVSGKGRSFHV